MIREARPDEYEFISQKCETDLRPESFWEILPYAYGGKDFEKFLHSISKVYGWIVLVDVTPDDIITGFIGGQLQAQLQPPNVRFVQEFMWWGGTRSKVNLFKEMEVWAEERGAVLSCFVIHNKPNRHSGSEELHWRRLRRI